MPTSFAPKQAIKIDGAILQELQGTVTESVANELVSKHLPPFEDECVVHDNGCGYGVVTMAVMAQNPPASIKIHATDINPIFLDQIRSTVKENPAWPVTVENMDAEKLSFDDNTFSHSITGFVFAILPDAVEAAKQIRRTVRPGGTAAVAVWDEVPWATAVENAHRKTRGDVPMGPFMSKIVYQQSHLDKALKAAGWEKIKYIRKEVWLSLGTDISRWATITWSIGGVAAEGWTQKDEDEWDTAITTIVEDVKKNEWYRFEDGIHKIRMVASVGIVQK